MSLTLPHLFSPRSYQQPPMAYIDNGGKRALTVWHRRAGKDQTWLNQVIKQMVVAPRCGTYPYIFPKLTQGRRDLWDAKTSTGVPFRSHFPPELVMDASETEMQITLKPMPHQNPQPISDGRGGRKYVGSIFQVMGTDKESMENLRGINAAGVVFSEYSDHDPAAWVSIFEPVLLENGGWAAFDFTPKGENHAYDLYKAGLQDPEWYVDLKTIADTKRDSAGEGGGPVIAEEAMTALRQRGTPEDIIQQEYYCSFRGFVHGTIYGDLMTLARAEKRVGHFPYDPMLPVGTCWDIGTSDHTAIWFYQMKGNAIFFIDYYEDRQKAAPHYAQFLRERKPYSYVRMSLPWDARFAAASYFSSTGFRGVTCAKMQKVQEGIDTVRGQFSTFYYDQNKCEVGIKHLENYKRDWDDEKKVFMKQPKHDQHSHASDALRTGAVAGFGPLVHEGMAQQIKVVTEFDPRSFGETGQQRGW